MFLKSFGVLQCVRGPGLGWVPDNSRSILCFCCRGIVTGIDTGIVTGLDIVAFGPHNLSMVT